MLTLRDFQEFTLKRAGFKVDAGLAKKDAAQLLRQMELAK